jgi:hypothetical protein
MTATRSTRESSRRATAAPRTRNTPWRRGGNLDIPKFAEKEGFTCMWVRCEVAGKVDELNMRQYYEMGYRPVSADEIPDGVMAPTGTLEKQGNVIKLHDLVLMRIDNETKAWIDESIHELSHRRAQSVRDNQFMMDAGGMGAGVHQPKFQVQDRMGRPMPMNSED